MNPSSGKIKPLSSARYFVRNKRRILPVVLVLILSTAIVFFIASMSHSVLADTKKANLKPLEYISLVMPTPGELFLKDNIVIEIHNIELIDKIYSVTLQYIGLTNLIRSIPTIVIIPDNAQDISSIMRIMEIEVDGRLPQEGDKFEIVMNERLLKNRGLKIGDFVGDDLNNIELLDGKYKIVGSFSKDIMVSFANKSPNLESLKQADASVAKPAGFLVIPKVGQLKKMNSRLEMVNKYEATISTYFSQKTILDDELTSLNTILSIFVFAGLLIGCLCISGMIHILYLSRNEEFGIIYAMGYQKSFIKNIILKEIIFLTGVCCFCGYGISLLIVTIINRFLLVPKGQTLDFFTYSEMLLTLLISVCVIICAVVPVLRRLKKWDPITIIERRE